ncbi:MAG: hypothetical protein OXD46_06860 [Chloroflexi bacterium]|nr:hypothetical protein [Chloroflexota bacterium]
MRVGLAFAKEPYLHSLRRPLDEAVALDETKLGDEEQADGFGNECEGQCGVEFNGGSMTGVSPLSGFGGYACLVPQRVEKQAPPVRNLELRRGVENERE